jgi:hypothetical protein
MQRGLPFVVLVAGLMPAAYGQSASDIRAPGVPMPVMSDTAEYCAQLEHRILAQPVRSADVRRLVSKGHQLCDHGQARRGVSYMRRALMMQRGEAPP